MTKFECLLFCYNGKASVAPTIWFVQKWNERMHAHTRARSAKFWSFQNWFLLPFFTLIHDKYAIVIGPQISEQIFIHLLLVFFFSISLPPLLRLTRSFALILTVLHFIRNKVRYKHKHFLYTHNKTQRKIDLFVSFLDLDTIRQHCNQSGTVALFANAVAQRVLHWTVRFWTEEN